MKIDKNSLAHSAWNCKYHIVFILKYGEKIIYNKLREDIQGYIMDLCNLKVVEIIKGHMMPHHVHYQYHQNKIYQVYGIFKREKCNDDISKTWKFKV